MPIRISKNRVALENIPLNEAIGANIASASTINLTTATGNTVHITGTTAITAVTLGAGMVRDVIFDGVLTLTHHVTNNNLPGGANITTAANDRARYISDGTTVYCVNYQKADGTAVGGLDINNLTEDTNPDESADFIPTYDVSAGANKKVKPRSISTWDFESSETTLSDNTVITAAHGLGARPKNWEVIYRCKTAEFGYAIDDEVRVGDIDLGAGGELTVWVDATNVGYVRKAHVIVNRSSFVANTMTNANWKLVFRARLN